MQVVVKVIQLVCVAISFTTCDKLFSQNDTEDQRMYQAASCSANCLSANEKLTLDTCFKSCETTSIDEQKKLKQIYENHDIKLLCRDDSSLAFHIIENDFSSSIKKSLKTFQSNLHKEIYFVKIHKAEKPTEQQRLLTNSSFVKVDNLEANTTYNITASIVHSSWEYSVIINNLQFSTLHKHYNPNKISNISLQKYLKGDQDKKLLKAVITWKPAMDMTCHYDILVYPTAKIFYSDMKCIEIRDIEHLYTYTIDQIVLGTEYTIGIRSRNTKELSKESELEYLYIKTPACLEWHNNNLTICPPLEPKDLEAVEETVSPNEFSINITWERSHIEPDYYTVKILDLDMTSEHDPNSLIVNVSKDQNSVIIPYMVIKGHEYEVYVTAHSEGGNSTASISKPIKNLQVPDAHHVLKLVTAIIVPLTIFALISMVTFIICHRRARVKRYKERCKYFEDLEKKAPMDPNSNFEFVGRNVSIDQLQIDLEDKLGFDDEMEINLTDVELYEVIGEGAFGYVRRGKLRVEEKKDIEVAIKMLKDQPSLDDIKTFRREIDVMKSVGSHPHIVGIMGHYTKNIKEMMLLTEFCSLGNLLDFLRAEWQRINKIVYVQKTSESPSNTPPSVPTNIASDNIFNFDASFVDKISRKYKNIQDNNLHNSNKPCKEPNKQDDISANIDNGKEKFQDIKLVVNKGYELQSGSCTNFCKCQVDIIESLPTTKLCLSPDENFTNGATSDSNSNDLFSSEHEDDIQKNKIHIKSCDCNSRYRKRRKYSNNNEDIKITECTELFVENQGYYKFFNKYENEKSSNKDPESMNLKKKKQNLSNCDLILIAKQISMGMEYLAKCKVVHRDLAARNVLVCEDRTVKIADFGLSRDVYQENVYKKTGSGKLPIKWLALESMTHQVYTTQSDVWSYGILLYEIATLGGSPYPSISTNRLLNLLKKGYRMEKPKNCGQSLYDLMASCWKTIPSERPTFTEIIQTLDDILVKNSEEKQIEDLAVELENDKRPEDMSDESYLNPLL